MVFESSTLQRYYAITRDIEMGEGSLLADLTWIWKIGEAMLQLMSVDDGTIKRYTAMSQEFGFLFFLLWVGGLRPYRRRL